MTKTTHNVAGVGNLDDVPCFPTSTWFRKNLNSNRFYEKWRGRIYGFSIFIR
jgi:hypothetical protein